MCRRSKPTLCATLVLGLVAGACVATAPYEGNDIYLAHYRPLILPPGSGVVVSLTASFDGRLAVKDGCLVMLARSGTSGTSVMPAFRDQVRLVTRGGKVGIEDTKTGHTAFVGDTLSLGGASLPEDSDFVATRLIASPPASCPETIFVSNYGFENRVTRP